MALHRFRLVLTETANEPFGVAYIGDDAAKAQEIFDRESVSSRNTSVRLYIYPTAAKTRHPSVESVQAAYDEGRAKVAAQNRVDSATTLARLASERLSKADEFLKRTGEALKTAERQYAEKKIHITALNARIKENHDASLASILAAKAVEVAANNLKSAEAALAECQSGAPASDPIVAQDSSNADFAEEEPEAATASTSDSPRRKKRT